MDWIPLSLPKPETGKLYDIRLKDGTEVFGVEYWDYGGGFGPLALGEKSFHGAAKNVKYPISEVKEYRPHLR
jgi:hypothetical protein